MHQGFAPNCSATGSVVGAALLTAAATAAVLNAVAAWLGRRAEGRHGEGEPPRLRRTRRGGVLWIPPDAPVGPARAELTEQGVRLALAGGARVIADRSAPDEAHLALTSRCPVGCGHCYLDARPDGVDADRGALIEALRALAARGTHEVALGGGEAALATGLIEAARTAKQLGLTPNLTTSGLGVTPTVARDLAPWVGQVNVSLDGPMRDGPTTRAAWRAIATLREVGIRVGINTVLTRLTWPGLDVLADALGSAQIAEWQWLRLKPAGRGAADYDALALRRDQALAIWPRLLEIEARTGLTMRIDCALVPFVAAHDIPPERLAAYGVLGCPGGERLLARTADGRWLPCSFASAVSKAQPDALDSAWEHDATLRAWRARAAQPPEPCASCEHRAVCRGGCRIVAAHLTGDPLAPDPECPKVNP